MFLLFPTFVDVKQLKRMIELPVLGSVSMYMGPEQIRNRRTKMITFLFSTGLLLAAFGGVLIYKDTGPTLVKAFVKEVSIYL
jgi:hypothetical protein